MKSVTKRDENGRGQRQALAEVGVWGIINVLRQLQMLDGLPKLPDCQVEVSGFVGMAPAYGGVMSPEVTRRDIGRVFPRGHVLGRILSPYTFAELDVLRALLEQNLLVAVRNGEPFTHVQPGGGDLGFSVVNWSTAHLVGGRSGISIYP